MKGTVVAILTDVKGKISSMNKKYHEVTFIEVIEKSADGFDKPSITWDRCYYPDVINHDHLIGMIDKKVLVECNIYNTTRRVGDATYQDLKLNVTSIAEIPIKYDKK